MTAKRGGDGKLCHVTAPLCTFRLSAPCCVYLIGSLFLLFAHLTRVSLVAMVTERRALGVVGAKGAARAVPAVVKWDSSFAAELRDPQVEKIRYDDPGPLQVRTREEEEKEEETNRSVIHFTDNLPIRQHDVIKQQADRMLAALIISASSSSSAKSASPSQEKQEQEEEKEEETNRTVIHFTDNLPIRQHDVIKQQADRMLAALIMSASSSAESASPSQEKQEQEEEKEEESVPSQDQDPTAKEKEAERNALAAAEKSHDQMIRHFQEIQDTYRKDARFHEYYNGTVEELPVPKKAVYLQANYRSESTFLGQIFNQHPDVFYTFEPLFPFIDSLGADRDRERAVIRANLRCDFIPALDQFRHLPPRNKKSNVVSECLINDMCFRDKTRGLCEGDRCATRNATGGCKACGPLSMKRLNNFCRQHKMVATKVIRLADLGALREIAEEPGMDVKVVHLIRDPRAIASSRYKLNKVWSRIGIQATCQRLVANARLAAEVAPSWLADRYMMVRYEDLSRDPIGVTSRIYDFVGLELLPEMRAWIAANTHTSSGLSGPYTTAQAWRGELSYGQVSEVQGHESCAKALDYFGYRPVHSPQHLTNTSLSLLDDL